MENNNVVELYSDARPQPRLSEDEVTIERIQAFFDAAVFDHEIDEDGEIYVSDGIEFPGWISIDPESKLIRFYTFWPAEHSSAEKVNALNERFKIVQFTLKSQNVQANYYLPFRHGADGRHIVIMARRFGAICRTAHTQLEQEEGAT